MTQVKPKEENNNKFKQIINFMFVRMFVSKGLKILGKRAVAALFREYKQFHDIDVYDIVQIDDISPDLKIKY